MTEYEVIDAINSTMALAYSVSQYGLAIMTGYLLIAHFIGAQLSVFQVWFVSIVFVVMHSMCVFALIDVSKKVQLLQIELTNTGSSIASGSFMATINRGDAIPWPPYLFGALLTFGCLLFMWQVRHART